MKENIIKVVCLAGFQKSQASQALARAFQEAFRFVCILLDAEKRRDDLMTYLER
jgi:hypothetical protein